MSVIHPGSSINFDAATLQQNEDEDEMLQEELRQQKELRELLSAELSDDLLDDDHSSVNDSHQSLPQDVSGTAAVTQGWMQGVHASQAITSTPGDELHNGYYSRPMNGYSYGQQNHYAQNYGNATEQYYDPSYGVRTSQPQQWHHQQNYGNNMMFQQQRDDGVGQYMHYTQNGGNLHHPVPHRIEETDEYPYAERGEVEGREDYDDVIDRNHIQQQQQYIQYKPERNGIPTSSGSLAPSPGSKSSYRQSYPPHTKNYHGPKQSDHYNKVYGNNMHEISAESSPADFDGPAFDKLQHEFNKVSNDLNREESGRQMAQLQILFKARGKKIEELSRELEELKAESAREKRILNHQLAMAKDQKDGMGTSLEESQRLVQAKDREVEDVKGKIDAHAKEIESLKSSKNELLTKIQVSERTIESLHEQLTQLSHSETIERARDQHDAVLSATTQRHEMQVLEITTQLDQCRREMNEKGEELEKVRFHLNKLSRESEQMLLDKTEAINRLTKSLEDAQNQCQGLLAGSNENAFARHQVSDLLHERKQNEEEIAYLKMQVSEAEDHLKLYENALQLGAGGTKNHPRHVRGGSLSDSLTELMGGSSNIARKLDWKTPQSKSQEFEAGSQEELIDGLRTALQRALKCNKAKRDEVTKLKLQCSELEDESSHWRTRADEAQTQIKLNASVSAESQAKTERVEESASIQELEEKFSHAEDEVERLEKTCTEVKQRMAEMIQEHDQDKQDAVERCERALMQLHEDAKQALRDELVSEHEQKLYEMSVDHDAKIREITSEIEQLQHELYDVKQSYVHVCAEKDSVQSSVQQELLEQFEQERESLLTEHQDAITKLEASLQELEDEMNKKIKEEKKRSELEWDKEREKLLQGLKREWEKEKESEFTQRMETQIALTKVNWFEEFSNSKQKAIHVATKAEEEKWTERIEELKQEWEAEKEQIVRRAISESKEEWDEQKELEIQKLQDKFQSDKEAAVKMATCLAELNKNLQKEGQDAEVERRMKEMEDVWKKDKQEALKKAKESWKVEKENLIQDAVEETRRGMEEQMESERNMHKSVMETAVMEIKKVCDQEKQSVLKQKTSDMEKEIKKLQEQHRNDYEKFVAEHKKTLASFLEREKARSQPQKICKDFSTQVQESNNDDAFEEKERLWKTERKELELRSKNEIAETQRKYQEKFEELRKEIQNLMTEKNDLTTELRNTESKLKIETEKAGLEHDEQSLRLKLEKERLESQLTDSEKRIEKLREQQKDDIAKLKDRMREEYRRWKKERANLILKLKENSTPRPSNDIEAPQTLTPETSRCKFCNSSQENTSQLLQHKDEATRKAVTELSEIYAGTLKMIKDEMMTFIGESRGRTKETISLERRRTVSKLKSHYTKSTWKHKPQKDANGQGLQRLKVFESETESRPDTPVLTIPPSEPSKTVPPSSIDAPQLLRPAYSDTRPKSLLIERYLNANDFNQYPTKLTPNSESITQPTTSAFTLRGPSSQPRGTYSYTPELTSRDLRGSETQHVPPQTSSPRPLAGVTVRSRDRQAPISSSHRPYEMDFSPRRARSDVALPEFSRIRNSATNPNTPSLGATYKPYEWDKR